MNEEKDYSKPISKIKDMLKALKKEVSTVSKAHAKMEKEEAKEKDKMNQAPTPEDHETALNHFKKQYVNAKRNKDEAGATDAARGYHDYSNKLADIYQRKLKEDKVCASCERDPCICDDSHGFINENENNNTNKGISMNPYLKPENQLDEVSKELANRYMHSAIADRSKIDAKVFAGAKKNRADFSLKRHDNITKNMVKSDKRTTGIGRALNRLTKEDVEQIDESLAVHGKYTIKTGAVMKGMGEGPPEHVVAHKGKLKAIGVKADAGHDGGHYGTTHRVSVKNNETGHTTYHHVYQSSTHKTKPVMSVRDVGAKREHQDEHHKQLKAYLSGKKPDTKYSGLASESYITEATVSKKGQTITVKHNTGSFTLQPEHQKAVKKLRPGMKTAFDDNDGRKIHASREGNNVHLVHHETGAGTATKVTVGYHHFDESVEDCRVCGQTPCNCTHINEIKMSGEDEAKYNVDYGKRATKLLKHSWSQHDVSKEKSGAGDKEGAEKASKTSSRAHKLFLKARDKHQNKPANREAHINRIMSGASDDYKKQEAKRGIGRVRD